MPYTKDWNQPHKDDVVWGNDSMVPSYKRFDFTDGTAEVLCTWDDACEEVSVGYRYDPDIGWTRVCYEHVMESLDTDLMWDRENSAMKPGPPPTTDPQRRTVADEVVPSDPARPVICDDPHDELPDQPPATVLITSTNTPKRFADKFVCATHALMFVNSKVAITGGQFNAFEMLPVTEKK